MAKAELRVASMVIIMVLTFLISWMPYAGLSMLVVYNPHVVINPLVATLPVYLAKSSTVYNPIIYIYCNKQVMKNRICTNWFTVQFILVTREEKGKSIHYSSVPSSGQ